MAKRHLINIIMPDATRHERHQLEDYLDDCLEDLDIGEVSQSHGDTSHARQFIVVSTHHPTACVNHLLDWLRSYPLPSGVCVEYASEQIILSEYCV